jgi:hypothetical protein
MYVSQQLTSLCMCFVVYIVLVQIRLVLHEAIPCTRRERTRSAKSTKEVETETPNPETPTAETVTL